MFFFTNFEIMPSKSKVCFFFEHKKFSLENRSKLKKFIESLFRKEKKNLSCLNYIFCTDTRLLEINRQFLKHNFYTDIISFELSDTGHSQGEIYISIDRVKENAKSLGISFKSELLRVIFHGALHLCGFKDKSKAEKKKIRDKEDLYLILYLKK